MLRDKSPKTLVEAQEQATKIEENILVSKLELFHAPPAKAMTKTRTLHNDEPVQDSVKLLAQRLEKIVIDFSHNQSLMMNKITNL
jgi:hypothetical protein